MKKTNIILLALIIFMVQIGMSESYGNDNIPLVLFNGNLIDGTGSQPIQNAIIIIKGDKILAAGSFNEVKIPAKVRRLDVKGATILPGFINANVQKGYDEKYLKACAQNGVTTVRDLSAWVLNEEWPARLNALKKDPLNSRLVAGGPLFKSRPGIINSFNSPDEAVQKTELLLKNGADLITIQLEYFNFNSPSYDLSIPAPSKEEVMALMKIVRSHGKVVSAYIAARIGVKRAIEAGISDICIMSCDNLPSDLIKKVVQADIYWVPSLELWLGLENSTVSSMFGYNLMNPIKNLHRFVLAGGKVALGSYDGSGFYMTTSGIPIREIELMQDAGMTPMQIIIAATKNAAHVCNLENVVGTIETGKIADILVVNGNPLEDLHVLKNIIMVIHNGVIIRQEKTITAIGD